MKDFNSYLDNLDYSLVKDLFHEKGKQRIYHKKDFFIRQNEISRFAEWVENGTFQYTYIDGEGEEHIVGYAFTNEFVCDYSSLMRSGLSLVNIQAITECSVYEISRHDIIEYWETDMKTQRFGRHVARQRRGIYVAFPDVHRLFLSINDCQKPHICQAYSSTMCHTRNF